MRDLDLKTLRLLVAVCDLQNIKAAAEQENIEPSAISKRIAQLESTLGTQVLIRSRRGVQPTPAGLALLDHARTLLFTVERLERDVAAYSGGLKGHVRLTASASAVAEALPDDIAAFMRQRENHDIRVDIEERTSRELVRAVREGFASLGICWDTVDFDGLEHLPYRTDDLAIVVHREHRLARHTAARIDRVRFLGRPAAGQQPFLMRVEMQRGEPGDPWAALQDGGVEFRESLDILPEGRTRADKADIAPQDVPDLRQLVQPGAPEDAAGRSYPPRLVAARDPAVGPVRRHGAELPKRERLIRGPHPLGAVKDRGPVAQPHHQRDDGDGGQHQRQQEERQRQIEDPLRVQPGSPLSMAPCGRWVWAERGIGPWGKRGGVAAKHRRSLQTWPAPASLGRKVMRHRDGGRILTIGSTLARTGAPCEFGTARPSLLLALPQA